MAEVLDTTSKETQASESEKTLAGAGSTESQPGGTIAFNAKAMYQNPLNPEEEITGAQLQQIVNRGTLFDKAQSQRDKERSERERLAVDNENLKIAKEKAEAELAQQTEKGRIAETIRDMGIGAKAQVSDWDDDDDKPTMTPEEITRRVEEIAERRVAAAVEALEKKNVDNQTQYLNSLKQEQETERIVSDTMSSARRVALQTQQANLPDIAATDIEAALDMQTLASLRDDEAREALRNRDTDTFQVKLFEAEELRTKAVDTMAQLRLQQATKTAEKERATEIESMSGGTRPPELSDIKPTVNKAKARENQRKRVEIATRHSLAREKRNNR